MADEVFAQMLEELKQIHRLVGAPPTVAVTSGNPVVISSGINPQELTKQAGGQYSVPNVPGMLRWQVIGGGIAPTFTLNGTIYTYFNNVILTAGVLYEFTMQIDPGDVITFTEATLHVWFLPGAL